MLCLSVSVPFDVEVLRYYVGDEANMTEHPTYLLCSC